MLKIRCCFFIWVFLFKVSGFSLAKEQQVEKQTVIETKENQELDELKNYKFLMPALFGIFSGSLTADFDILTGGRFWPITWFLEYYYRSNIVSGKERLLARSLSWLSYAIYSRNQIKDPFHYLLLSGMFLGPYLSLALKESFEN